MRVYNYSGNDNIIVAEIKKTELYRIDFASCNEPKETLQSYYDRQNVKPTLLINGGFFNMTTGEPVFNYVDESKVKASNAKYKWGMGVIDDANLIYSSLDSRKWRDFISGYPNLIDNGQKLTINFATEIANYNARRTAIGYNKDTIYSVCVMNPGVTISKLQDIMLNLGCTYAINLDGGGSTNMLYNGHQMTTDGCNRAVDNVVAFYVASNTKEESDETKTSNNTKQYTQYHSSFLVPDKTVSVKVGNNTLIVSQKICPDNLYASKDIASYVKKDDHMKPCALVNNGTGKPRGITIHNTGSFKPQTGTTMAEQSARAFYNGNGGGAIVHYFVDEQAIWQLLCTDTNKVERGWHASDGSSRTASHNNATYDTIGGNLDTIAIECIGNSSAAENRTAILTAYLCKQHGLNPETDIYTHNYFMNQEEKIVTVKKNGQRITKNCPVYILPHLTAFIANVRRYYNMLSSSTAEANTSTTNTTVSATPVIYKVIVDAYFNSYDTAVAYKNIIDSTLYINSLIIKSNNKYYIQCASFKVLSSAQHLVDIMKSYTIPAKII